METDITHQQSKCIFIHFTLHQLLPLMFFEHLNTS